MAVERETRTQEITRVLRGEVLGGRYRPGERLPSERDLAARFAATRGIVRVALKQLEQLGIADVQPGGTRVAPIEHASLDVVGHLLDLRDPPDPELVDQILEVAGALLCATARIAVEHADSAQLTRARALTGRLQQPDLGPEDRFDLLRELAQVRRGASHNLVLDLVHRGLRTQFLERFRSAEWRPDPDPAQLQLTAKELGRALDERDSAGASEALHGLWRSLRAGVRHSLERMRREQP